VKHVKRIAVIVSFWMVLWLVLAGAAFAQSPTPGGPSWSDALHFMVGPGAAALAGLIISFLSEYWTKFQTLEAKKKVLAYIGLCVFSALLGTALAVATGVWGAWLDIQTTWWPAIWAGLAASGIGTLFHAWVPEPLKQSSKG
jgi:hypothetical protein